MTHETTFGSNFPMLFSGRFFSWCLDQMPPSSESDVTAVITGRPRELDWKPHQQLLGMSWTKKLGVLKLWNHQAWDEHVIDVVFSACLMFYSLHLPPSSGPVLRSVEDLCQWTPKWSAGSLAVDSNVCWWLFYLFYGWYKMIKWWVIWCFTMFYYHV